MKRMIKVISLLLVMMMLFTPCAQAARLPMEGRTVLYGTINVVPIGMKEYNSYQAARDDENGIVYIHSDDLADILGAQLVKSSSAFEYSLGNWEVRIRTDKGTATVCYDYEPNTGSIHGNPLDHDFALTDCLYDELNEAWYFPFEEVMYMMALQWMCVEGTVYIYRPETLLDILSESEKMLANRPQYEDLMGTEWWEQWGNSAKYAIASSLDELDMTFLWDGAASAGASVLGETHYSQYEMDVITNALLMLQSDSPANPDDAYTEALDTMGTFVSALSTVVELSGESEEVYNQVNTLLQKSLHVSVPQKAMQTLAPAMSVGSSLIGYALSVGQTVYVRDNLPKDFAQRLQLIEECAGERRDDNAFYKALEKAAGDAYDTYYGSAIHSLTDHVSLDLLANLVDNTLQMGDFDLASNAWVAQDGGIAVLRWMNLAVSTIDLSIEVAANVFPPLANALEKGENAHLCKNLIFIGNMMEKSFGQLYEELKLSTSDLTQEHLTNVRTALQLVLSSSLHASELLTAIDRGEKPAEGYPETACLARILESAKYDKLLLMDTNFSNIAAEEEGYVRHDIPVEYVRIIEPVIVMTETERTQSEHYYSRICQPVVYAKANPKLGAAVDAVLDPIFNETRSDVSRYSASAASCQLRDASYSNDHYDIAYLTSAYSNGHFLSLGVANGGFDCSIGHSWLHRSTYVFDVASGAQLDLPDLLNTKEDPKAEKKFINLIDQLMDETGTRYAADRSPSDVSAKDMYKEMKSGRYAHWEITPEGIYVSVEALNMDVMIHGFLIPFDRLDGILKKEYLPAEASGAASYEMKTFSEDMLKKDSGITVYNNSAGPGALALNGLTTHLWIGNGLGRADQPIDGTCAYFYGFGVQNCLITMPEPQYEKYGYEISWVDAKGSHSEDIQLKK